MAPIKALCSQRFDDWKEKFGPIGLTCKELTGDTVMDDLFEIQHANIIMTTPVSIIYVSLFTLKYISLFRKIIKRKYKAQACIFNVNKAIEVLVFRKWREYP